MLDYSIYIRTLGYGGEKYQRLLNSINSQTIKPQKVVMVLPLGYKPPVERLGYEVFEYCDKGMLKQRIFAIDNCKTEYVLLLDDDVEFESRFVEKLYNACGQANANIATSVITTDQPKSLLYLGKNLINYLCLSSGILISDSYYLKLNMVGGYLRKLRPKKEKLYLSESGHGSHCFALAQVLRDLHFEQELWLEDSKYPLPEDQVFFYKLSIYGNKIVTRADTLFNHLDARSTSREKRNLLYAKARNYHIFWRKFIYKRQKNICSKIACTLAINYRHIAEIIFIVIPASIMDLNFSYISTYIRGWHDGVCYNFKILSR